MRIFPAESAECDKIPSVKLSSQPPAISAPKMPLAFRTRRQFHDTPGDIIFRAALSALAPLALAAALLAIPADEARAHDDTSATLHAETYPLHQAADEGDLDSVNHFIAVHTVAVNAKKADDGSTPLHSAAWRARFGGDSASIISVLISAGADVNAKDGADFAPLHYVAVVSRPNSRQAVPIVSALIAAGADVNAKGNRGRTPLHGASHLGIISVLIAEGADVNAKNDDDETPLHFAAYYNHASAASALIAEGADVHAKNDDDETPLDVAAREGHAFAVSALIEAGANWGEACATSAVVNPAGPSPPCICEPPSVGTPENCVAPSVESCGGLTPAKFYSATLSACVAVAECASPSILNAEANRCDCPAPNVGADGADAPGNCAAPSAESCGGLTPPQFYSPTLSTCAPYDECLAAGDCALSATACGWGLYRFYDAGAAECVPFVECASPLVLHTDVNKCYARTLHRAASAGDLDSVNHFITVHSASVNAKDSFGQAPLHYAVHHGHVSIVATLIAAGADVNVKSSGDNTPLHYATWGFTITTGGLRHYSVSIVSALIAAGADVHAKNQYGATPLHGASHLGIVSALIAEGADVNAKNNGGYTPLHGASHLGIVTTLIAAGADVHAKNNDGETPLHGAARRSVSIVSALIAAGADVHAKNNDGETPLRYLFSGGAPRSTDYLVTIISTLIAAGADVNAANSYGITPLHGAAASDVYNDWGFSVVSVLIAAGADVNAKNSGDYTPLHYAAAAEYRHVSIVATLLAAGADVNAKNHSGETPLRQTCYSNSGNISCPSSRVTVRRVLIAAGGHWGEACANAAVVNPAGPSPPCLCESPNVETNLGACEVVAVCDSPSVLNAGTNRCDCPAPNIGTDGADAPGDCHAENALHEAARTGDLDAVNHFLADHMASVNATISGYPHYGGTPLHSAMRSGVCDSAIASKLIAAGADVNANANPGSRQSGGDRRATPLNTALDRRPPCPAMVSVLVGAGAKVCSGEGCSYKARPPLYHLARRNATSPTIITVAQIFIQRGDDVNLGGSYTPLYDAWADAAASLSANSRPHGWFGLVDFLIKNGGHYGRACTKGHIVNPRPTPITTYAEARSLRSGERDACICPAGHIITDLDECEIPAVCASPSVLDAGANRCDCPAPNVGTDGADAPGVCAVPSAQVCGGEDPPEYYAATLSACVPFADCRAGATLDGETNTCECAPPSALDGTGLGCEFTSASCMAATLHYTGTDCEPLADCTAPAVRNEGTNLCECLAPNLNFGGGDCRAPSAANCAEHYDPPKFYDQAAGECGNTLFPCHDSAKRKADNSGCECPAGTFAHGDPSGGYRRTSQYGARHKNGRYEYIPDTAECHADHAPISHSLSIRAWGDAIKADNATLALHFISQHEYSPNALIKQPFSAYGIPPLHFAIGNDAPRVATILIDRGADTDATTLLRDGLNTPLHLAARKTDTAENVGLISFLLGKGADPNPRNSVGWRPLDLSFHGGNAATWQARRGIMAALIAGGATWSDECTGGAIPNEGYRGTEQVAIYPECKCPPHISQRDDGGTCECPAYSHSQVNGRCLPKDSAQVEAEILKMETELLRLRTVLASLNLQLSLAVEAPREMVEEIAEQAGDTAQEIKRRRDNFLALARADLAGAPPPPVAMSDTAAECRMLGGEVQIHSATGIRVCSGIDANDTFCLVDSGDAYPCRGLFRHVRTCNDDYNRRALNPFFCGARCGAQKAVGKDCAAP